MRAGVLGAVLLVFVCTVECKRSNGAYCDDARPCPLGFACDLVARQCRAGSGSSSDMATTIDMAGCTCSSTTPICVAMTCVSCLSTSDSDAACAAASPSTPYCMTTGAAAGSCVGCRTSNDCGGATPFCDANTNTCRGCVADLECPSYVCDLTPGSVTHGVCVPMNQVEYVDGSAATNGTGLIPTSPRQKVQDGVNRATGPDNRPYVRVAAGDYNEAVFLANGGTVYIVGANGTALHPTGGGDAIGSSMGSSVTIRNITAQGSNGFSGNCQNATLSAYRSQFIKSGQSGVYAKNCALVIDGCWIDGNTDAGIYLDGGNWQILNSIITHNVSFGGVYQLTTSTSARFVNNTVADNTSTTTYAGISCATATSFAVQNSILFNDKNGGTVTETNCALASSASDAASAGAVVDLTSASPAFVGGTPSTAGSYHLQSTSPCIDRASASFAPDHDFDFEPRPDRKSMTPDIGADEFQQ